MNKLWRCSLSIVIALSIIPLNCFGKNFKRFQEIHKKVSDDLICIRKEFSATQPKIYALLDHVDALNRITQEIRTKKNSYKKKYHDLNNQATLLANKNLMLKEKVQGLSDDLEKAVQGLAQEQQFSSGLKNELEALKAEKEVALAQKQNGKTSSSPEEKSDTQSLSLTSTSDPTSPR
jgi:chromosome segregation ATPase